MGAVNTDKKGNNLAFIPRATRNSRANRELGFSPDPHGKLTAITAQGELEEWYRGKGGKWVIPIGPRKGTPEMIRLADVPGVAEQFPTALKFLGPYHLVPKDPNDPAAQRTIVHDYSWGEMRRGAGDARADKKKRSEHEKKATKRARGRAKAMAAPAA